MSSSSSRAFAPPGLAEHPGVLGGHDEHRVERQRHLGVRRGAQARGEGVRQRLGVA